MPAIRFFEPLSAPQKNLLGTIQPFLPSIIAHFTEMNPAVACLQDSLPKVQYQHEFLALKMLIRVLCLKDKVKEEEMIHTEKVLQQCDRQLQLEKDIPFYNAKISSFEKDLRFLPTLLVTLFSLIALMMFYTRHENNFVKKMGEIALICLVLGAGTFLTLFFLLKGLRAVGLFLNFKSPGLYVPINYQTTERDYGRFIEGLKHSLQTIDSGTLECPFSAETLSEISDISSELHFFSIFKPLDNHAFAVTLPSIAGV